MTTFPMDFPSAPYLPDVRKNHEALRIFLKRRGIDVLVVGSANVFMAEYTPACDNQRAALSGFMGSTGEGLFLSPDIQAISHAAAPFLLMVDGRYHLQADSECDASLVWVDKLGMDTSPDEAPLKWLDSHGSKLSGRTIAVDGPRTAWSRMKALQALCQKHGMKLVVLEGSELSHAITLPGFRVERPITEVPFALSGRSTAATVAALQRRLPEGCLPSETCMITCAVDDAACLLNARGFHTQNCSGVMAWTFLIGTQLVVYLPEESKEAPLEISPPAGITLAIVRADISALAELLRKHSGVRTVAFAASTTNGWLPTFALSLWPQAVLHDSFQALVDIRAEKTPQELACMRQNFLRQSRAIARTLRWLRDAVIAPVGMPTSDPEFNNPPTEDATARKISKEYFAEGAVSLAFDTISSVDETAAIVHYKDASPQRTVKPGSMFLLDSGAYFQGGYSTDCTRIAYCAGPNRVPPQEWQKDIYTTCLKSFVAGMRAVFPKNTPGREVDALVRGVTKAAGYDYAHGTGHGLGILVHEPGHCLRTGGLANRPLVENGTVSMEPGIYLAGKGGVRIENIVAVREHPEKPEYFCFENLTWVGLEWDLIDTRRLNDEEAEWLRVYEKRCRELGTQIVQE